MSRPSQRTARERRSFNHKRRIDTGYTGNLPQLATQVRYTGHSKHKRNPGDFCLTPPAEPRDDATLCDDAGIFTKAEAQRLLREGVRRGLISEQKQPQPDGLPQNIWAVTDDGYPLEAQLENRTQGTYHGYPVPDHDPFRNRILEHWNRQ